MASPNDPQGHRCRCDGFSQGGDGVVSGGLVREGFGDQGGLVRELNAVALFGIWVLGR